MTEKGLDGLLPLRVKQLVDEFAFAEIYPVQVHAAYVAVVHSLDVDFLFGKIRRAGKLCGRWHIWWRYSLVGLCPNRQVKIVEQVKCLEHSLFRCLQHRRRALEECSPDKA